MSLPACAVLYGLVFALSAAGAVAQPARPSEPPRRSPGESPRPSPPPQPRPHGTRVAVDPARIAIDDGDSVAIHWPAGDQEMVRILGIDTPEIRHPEHDLPYAQAFGPEARAFAMGAFATATRVELLRAATLDPYGRSLGYLFLDGRNYSPLVIRARLAEESVSRYGDNGFPKEAAEVLAAGREQGPLAFEPPADYRARMRELSRAMKARGEYPER